MNRDDCGEHLWLWIEKRGLNSQHVASRACAACLACGRSDVSFAGMKHRHAVTRRGSACVRPRSSADTEGGRRLADRRITARAAQPGVEISPGNTFTIQIRELRADPLELGQRLEMLRDDGVPNYFGEQRFGRDGANVERARAWISHLGRVPRFRRSRKACTCRPRVPCCSNAVLAQRVTDGTWRTVLDGDVVDGRCPNGPVMGPWAARCDRLYGTSGRTVRLPRMPIGSIRWNIWVSCRSDVRWSPVQSTLNGLWTVRLSRWILRWRRDNTPRLFCVSSGTWCNAAADEPIMSQFDLQGIGMTSQRTRDRLVKRAADHGIADQRVLDIIGVQRRAISSSTKRCRIVHMKTQRCRLATARPFPQPFIVALIDAGAFEQTPRAGARDRYGFGIRPPCSRHS